jgi:hypothetical protein
MKLLLLWLFSLAAAAQNNNSRIYGDGPTWETIDGNYIVVPMIVFIIMAIGCSAWILLAMFVYAANHFTDDIREQNGKTNKA